MIRYPCFGTYDNASYACENACAFRPGCSRLTATISSIKYKPLTELATYLTDNEPLARSS